MKNQLTRAARSRTLIPNDFVVGLDQHFEALGCEEWSMSRKGGGLTVRTKDIDGRVTHAFSYASHGFTQRNVTTCDVLDKRERKKEARRLRRERLTQAAIAARLGVSQKTISNDLAGR